MSVADVTQTPAKTELPAEAITTRTIITACIGTALEWYDVFAYLYFSLTIAKLFFPTSDPTVSLLVAAGTYALTYIAKPFGAFFFASYADRVSRKRALVYTLGLMAVGVALITFTPSYQTIGVTASIIMMLARLIQGFSSGGEYGASTAFLVERAPSRWRGYYASFNIAAIGLTSVLGGVFGILVHSLFTAQQVDDWAWRLPFALGLLIIPVSVYMRRQIPELEGKIKRASTPLRQVLKNHKMLSLLGIGAFAPITITNTALAFFLPTYAIKFLHIEPDQAFIATAIYGGLQCLLSPVAGYASDLYGRRRIMAVAAIILAALAIPSFYLLVKSPSLTSLIACEVALGIFATAYQGPMPALLCDLYPAELRATGVAVVHDITATVLNGFLPFMITLFVSWTGSAVVPGVFIAVASAIAFLCIRALVRYDRGIAGPADAG
jgi:MHS family proline/betaine transporter-like MFS transporter